MTNALYYGDNLAALRDVALAGEMMRRIAHVLLMAVIVSMAASPVHAERVRLGDVTLELHVPGGYCPLSRDQPRDRQILEHQDAVQKPLNQVLLYVAPCEEIAAFRRGDRNDLSRNGVWLHQIAGPYGRLLPAGTPRASVGRMLSGGMPKATLDEIAADTSSGLKPAGSPANVKSMAEVRVDDQGLFMAFKHDSGRPGSDLAGVSVLSAIDRYPVSFQMYRHLDGADAYRSLMADVSTAISSSGLAKPLDFSRYGTPIDATEASQREPASSQPDLFGIDWWRVLNKGAAGAVVGGVLGLIAGLYWLVRRAIGRKRGIPE